MLPTPLRIDDNASIPGVTGSTKVDVGKIPKTHLRPLNRLEPHPQCEARQMAIETELEGTVIAAHVLTWTGATQYRSPSAKTLLGSTIYQAAKAPRRGSFHPHVDALKDDIVVASK